MFSCSGDLGGSIPTTSLNGIYVCVRVYGMRVHAYICICVNMFIYIAHNYLSKLVGRSIGKERFTLNVFLLIISTTLVFGKT